MEMQILVVEDEKRIADFLSRGLQGANHGAFITTGRLHHDQPDRIVDPVRCALVPHDEDDAGGDPHDQAAELLHLETLLTRKPAELSGGQWQRISVARGVFAMSPTVCRPRRTSSFSVFSPTPHSAATGSTDIIARLIGQAIGSLMFDQGLDEIVCRKLDLAAYPADHPVTPQDLGASLLRALGVDPARSFAEPTAAVAQALFEGIVYDADGSVTNALLGQGAGDAGGRSGAESDSGASAGAGRDYAGGDLYGSAAALVPCGSYVGGRQSQVA